MLTALGLLFAISVSWVAPVRLELRVSAIPRCGAVFYDLPVATLPIF
jgi:hypothetical protein